MEILKLIYSLSRSMRYLILKNFRRQRTYKNKFMITFALTSDEFAIFILR